MTLHLEGGLAALSTAIARFALLRMTRLRVFYQRGLRTMSKLLATLLGATLAALALAASAQPASSPAPVTAATAGQNPAATAGAEKKSAVKAKHHKQRMNKAKLKAKAHVHPQQ
jgi:hypothetical protein